MPESVIDRAAVMKQLQAGTLRLDDLPAGVVERMTANVMLDRDSLQAVFDDGIARDRRSPAVGDPAPDFSLELVDRQGRRTGELKRLSDHRDRPVALIFGSYT